MCIAITICESDKKKCVKMAGPAESYRLREMLEILRGVFDQDRFDTIKNDLAVLAGVDGVTAVFKTIGELLEAAVAESYAERINKRYELLTTIRKIEQDEDALKEEALKLARRKNKLSQMLCESNRLSIASNACSSSHSSSDSVPPMSSAFSNYAQIHAATETSTVKARKKPIGMSVVDSTTVTLPKKKGRRPKERDPNEEQPDAISSDQVYTSL